jgi:tRNA uridine 5-carboxymethylaminomethyl modification enzyme
MVELESARLKQTWVQPNTLSKEDAISVLGKEIEREYSLHDLLRRPDVTYESLKGLPQFGQGLESAIAAEQVEIRAKYQGYIDRQKDEVDKARTQEDQSLSADLDYNDVPGLSIEVKQKLNRHKPENIGQASRISGITPAAISILLVYLKRFGDGRKKLVS